PGAGGLPPRPQANPVPGARLEGQPFPAPFPAAGTAGQDKPPAPDPFIDPATGENQINCSDVVVLIGVVVESNPAPPPVTDKHTPPPAPVVAPAAGRKDN